MGEPERIAIDYVRLDQAVLWERNPKSHDIGGLVQSIERHGFRDAPIYDAALGAIVAGNGRLIALNAMMNDGYEPPRGIALHEDDGMWCAPVQFGVDAASQLQAEVFAIDHNNLVLTGGDADLWDVLAIYDKQQLAEIAEGIAEAQEVFVTLAGDDIDLLLRDDGDEPKPEGIERWSFRVYYEAPVALHQELVDLMGPYFIPRSKCNMIPEFFTAMVKSYCAEGRAVLVE